MRCSHLSRSNPVRGRFRDSEPGGEAPSTPTLSPHAGRARRKPYHFNLRFRLRWPMAPSAVRPLARPGIGRFPVGSKSPILPLKLRVARKATMTARAFDTLIGDGQTLVGPWRAPQQMLAAQVYDGHVSIHDDAMAKKMGFKAATIEGPTHFSQFAPLCARLWGDAWFETGCISAHYRNAVFAGEEVQ